MSQDIPTPLSPPDSTNIELELSNIDANVNADNSKEWIQKTTFKTYREDEVINEEWISSGECNLIGEQLQELCKDSDLNYEYTLMSMFSNNFTSVIFRTTKNKTTNIIDHKVLGFVSYSIKQDVLESIQDFTKDKVLEVINTDIKGIVNTANDTLMSFSNDPCIEIGALITLRRQGTGSLLINFLKSKHHIFLKSITDAYWFYIKEKCIPFYHDKLEYYELPYKLCYNGKYSDNTRSYHTGYEGENLPGKIIYNTDNLNPITCNDNLSRFASWFTMTNNLIPLILPCVPIKGGVNLISDYIVVLGRRRKIVMKANKKMVNVGGTLVSLRDAKTMEKYK